MFIASLFIAGQSLSAVGKGSTALGLMLGEPSAVSFKHFLSKTNAIDAGVGLSSFDGGLWLHGDYVWQFWDVLGADLPFYVGPGLILRSRKDKSLKGGGSFAGIGLRGLVGIEYHFKEATISIFLEGAVHLYLISQVDLGGGASIGIRYWFK